MNHKIRNRGYVRGSSVQHNYLTENFGKHNKKGVTLKASNSFDGGFRISANNSGAYYDYSAEAVTDMLSNYLSPKVTELLKEAE